ncbi:DUF4129 domain-containing protein [Pedobacter nyackensis]|uniref:Protein-glutamine gamma-glutamyltransferase-like C-terminal domain-containing protein n=1 Tax=Pedobacter nyackensis TaxID=475255 RepID=A0A1W2BFY9_9SPHI|nr:DUF4129 domain-containing protein [Pedobacter nyackensis]SMC71650.1 protein of unknown function [Pedobacter nyackensis]
MYRALIVFLLIFITANGFSGTFPERKPVKNIPLKNDTTRVSVRNFDLQKIKEYSSQQDFRYDDAAPVEMSWWDRFWRWFWNLFSSVFSGKYSGSFLKYAVIFTVVGLVIFAVIKLIGLDIKIFAGKSKAIDVPYNESLENIHEINFNEEIEKAVAKGNYRLAVRLLYLLSLKLLNDKELINWQPEKTNHTYISEIADPDRKREFSALTLQFEYIWYGEFFIDKDSFSTVKGSFERFNVKSL